MDEYNKISKIIKEKTLITISFILTYTRLYVSY